MTWHTTAITGAALFALVSQASAQNVAQLTKNGKNLVINSNDVRFNRGGSHGEGDTDTVKGWINEMDAFETSFNEALRTFKSDAKASVSDALVENKATITEFNTQAETSLTQNNEALTATIATLDSSLETTKQSFEQKVAALKASIEDKLAEYERLAETIPAKIAEIQKATTAETAKADEDINAFGSSLGPKVALVTKELVDKETDTKFVWAGGTTRSDGGGWGWLGLDRVDLDAKGDKFTVSGTTFTVRKAGLYRLAYHGIQRGANCNGYSLVAMNGRWISGYHYNKHISGWQTYNPQNVDFLWKYSAGDRVQLYIYDCRTRIYGSAQGALTSYNRITFSYEGDNQASMIAKG